MIENLLKGFRKLSNKFIHSIAFVPAVMGLGFLMVAIVGIELDNNGVGKALNEKVKWLTLKDASTARTIIGTVAAGIISLTVFSFSMVMVVMNQAASQMSNRMLDNMIGDKVQKVILGFYIGTIVYSLFLLTTISEASNDLSVPVLSIYMLLAVTVLDIFLFVYFLHYITQSIRYEQLIQRIHNRTYQTLRKITTDNNPPVSSETYQYAKQFELTHSGYFQGFSLKRLLTIAVKEDLRIEFLYPKGTYILEGMPFVVIHSNQKPSTQLLDKILLDIDFYYGQEIDNNPYFGYQHLMEVGIKALSPGINDPGTAVLSLNAISNLLLYKMRHTVQKTYNDKHGITRIETREPSFEELFEVAVLPIWDYGQKDRLVQKALLKVLAQLIHVDKQGLYHHLFNDLKRKVQAVQLQ